MKIYYLTTLILLWNLPKSLAKPQLSFGGAPTTPTPTTTSTTDLPEVATRVGPLLADVIGKLFLDQ